MAMTSIALRPIGPDDLEFLFRVYASTRAAEMAVVPWDEAQKEAFLRMQFAAQDSYYHANFPSAYALVYAKTTVSRTAATLCDKPTSRA